LIGSTENPYARIVRIDDIQDQSMVNKRELDELTPQEAQAAAYRAQGLTQSDAYRRAYNVKRAKPKTVHEKASRIRGSRALAAVRCARSSSRSVPIGALSGYVT
jgi:hypothetical protein